MGRGRRNVKQTISRCIMAPQAQAGSLCKAVLTLSHTANPIFLEEAAANTALLLLAHCKSQQLQRQESTLCSFGKQQNSQKTLLICFRNKDTRDNKNAGLFYSCPPITTACSISTVEKLHCAR